MREDVRQGLDKALDKARRFEAGGYGRQPEAPSRRRRRGAARAIVLAVLLALPREMTVGALRDELEISESGDGEG